MATGVVNAMQARHQLGKQRFIGAAMAEIGTDRLDQGLTLVAEQIAQRLEPLLTLGSRWHRVGGVRGPLRIELPIKCLQWLL